MKTDNISFIYYTEQTLARGRHRQQSWSTERTVEFYQENGDRRSVWKLVLWNHHPDTDAEAKGEAHYLSITPYWGRENDGYGIGGFKHTGEPSVYELKYAEANRMFKDLKALTEQQFVQKGKSPLFWRSDKPVEPFILTLPKKLEAA